jgi:anti-sigma28 factor (negative regulator of flagellin synthesis)
MKVYGAGSGAITGAEALAARIGKARTGSSGESARTSDASGSEVRVSREAMSLAAARVERLRDTRESGQLTIDAKAIAKRLAEEN